MDIWTASRRPRRPGTRHWKSTPSTLWSGKVKSFPIKTLPIGSKLWRASTGLAYPRVDDRFWLYPAERPATRLPPHYPQQPTLAGRPSAFPVYVGLTPSCGRSRWGCRSSAGDPEPTFGGPARRLRIEPVTLVRRQGYGNGCGASESVLRYAMTSALRSRSGIRPRGGTLLLRAMMGISAHSFSLADRPVAAVWVTRSRMRQQTVTPSRVSLSQTSVGFSSCCSSN